MKYISRAIFNFIKLFGFKSFPKLGSYWHLIQFEMDLELEKKILTDCFENEKIKTNPIFDDELLENIIRFILGRYRVLEATLKKFPFSIDEIVLGTVITTRMRTYSDEYKFERDQLIDDTVNPKILKGHDVIMKYSKKLIGENKWESSSLYEKFQSISFGIYQMDHLWEKNIFPPTIKSLNSAKKLNKDKQDIYFQIFNEVFKKLTWELDKWTLKY